MTEEEFWESEEAIRKAVLMANPTIMAHDIQMLKDKMECQEKNLSRLQKMVETGFETRRLRRRSSALLNLSLATSNL